jgi:hypothetical protein
LHAGRGRDRRRIDRLSKVYFARTVPPVAADSGSLEDRLRIVVHNTGNYFFEAAVARQLANFATLADVEELDDPSATLVLSMSNFISPATDLGHVAELLERKRVERVVMIGAGAQADNYGDRIELSAGTRRFLALLSERSTSIGVRGDYTAQVLNELGIKNVDVIGCPSMFYSLDPAFKLLSNRRRRKPLRAVFHCTPTGLYRDCIARLITFGVRHCGAYVAQSETFLLGLVSDAQERRAETEFFFHYYNDGAVQHDVALGWFRSHTHWFFDLEDWFGFMKGFDLAFGSRFHGNIAALLMGVPALNMVFDTRTRELCEYLNLPFMHLKNFSTQTSLRELHDAADFSLFNATYPAKYQVYRSFLLKNGLETTLAPPAGCAPALDAVRQRTVERLVGDLAGTGLYPTGVEQALRNRLERGREHAEGLRVESGEFERAEPLPPPRSETEPADLEGR